MGEKRKADAIEGDNGQEAAEQEASADADQAAGDAAADSTASAAPAKAQDTATATDASAPAASSSAAAAVAPPLLPPPSPIELTYEQRCASVGVLPAETLAAALCENDAALAQLRVYRAAAAASIADAPESGTFGHMRQ